MYVKTKEGKYVGLENGHTLGVQKVNDPQTGDSWKVYSHATGNRAVTLEDGYPTEEEARDALDKFVDAIGISIVAVTPPASRDDENE